MRDRLIELIQTSVDGCARHWAEVIADHLLESGAILPPCKVGDTVYFISSRYETIGRRKTQVDFVDEGVVDNIVVGQKGVPQIDVCNDDNVWMLFDADEDFGRVAFLTREEAERVLKGGGVL
jgi:hypothetical protein